MRSILMDTCVFLWWISDDHRLGQLAKKIIANPATSVYVSAATPWEIGIKRCLGKLQAPDNIDTIIEESGFKPLSISCFHAKNAAQLPAHHKDPFDRVMIAQAQAEGLEVLTADTQFLQYGIRVIEARS